jgi:biopolymer transport protein ExbD
MARHKTTFIETEPEAQLDISSLIDVCFLLLIYFLVTSTIAPRETDLLLSLPNEISAPSSPIPPLFIRVDEQGAVFIGKGINERPMDTDPSSRDIPLLASYLDLYQAAAKSTGEKPLVQVWVDPEVRQQRVMDVLNALAAAKIADVTFTDLVEKT